MWRPIILTDKATGRSVHVSIFEHEMYLAGFFPFDDLWEARGLIDRIAEVSRSKAVNSSEAVEP